MKDSKANTTIVDAAVDAAQKVLHARRLTAVDASIAYLFWYGAVDISHEHCVIWVLLTGPGSEKVPAWCFALEDLPDDLRRELATARDEVIMCLKAAGWTWEAPRIGFESTERVGREGPGRGGLAYFQ